MLRCRRTVIASQSLPLKESPHFLSVLVSFASLKRCGKDMLRLSLKAIVVPECDIQFDRVRFHPLARLPVTDRECIITLEDHSALPLLTPFWEAFKKRAHLGIASESNVEQKNKTPGGEPAAWKGQRGIGVKLPMVPGKRTRTLPKLRRGSRTQEKRNSGNDGRTARQKLGKKC